MSSQKKLGQMTEEFMACLTQGTTTPPPATARDALGTLAANTMAGDHPDIETLLDIISNYRQQMCRLITREVDLEQIETTHANPKPLTQRLLPMVEQAIEALRVFTSRHRVTCELHPQTIDGYVSADRDKMMRELMDFLSGVISFSLPDTVIDVRIARIGQKMHLCASIRDITGLSIETLEKVRYPYEVIIVSKTMGLQFRLEIPVAPRPQVLHVEPDDSLHLAAAVLLEPEFKVTHVRSVTEARYRMEAESFNLIMAGGDLAEGASRDTLFVLAAMQASAPLLVFV